MKKKRLFVGKVMSDLLNYTNSTYDSFLQSLTLLYVGGEGWVGKSQLIKAVVAAIDLIHHKEEVIVIAPTGTATDVVRGSAYYTSLRISLDY
jgi:tRNA G37 N-methylase TrmD